MNRYSNGVTGSADSPKMYKCKRWERRLTVSEDELAAYEKMLIEYPAMIDDNYAPYEDFCAEFSDEEVEPLWGRDIPKWLDRLQRTDVPLAKLFSSKEPAG